jgi:hypothetical protein
MVGAVGPFAGEEAVGVREAIAAADGGLPGEPVAEGIDPRWQAVIAVGEYVESDPEPVWQFTLRWGAHPQEDLRDAVATCLLEHLLECHFEAYFPRVERAALTDAAFADTVQRCWPFGQAEEAGRAERFAALVRRLGRPERS